MVVQSTALEEQVAARDSQFCVTRVRESRHSSAVRFIEIISKELSHGAVRIRPEIAPFVDGRIESVSDGSAVWLAALDYPDELFGWVLVRRSADDRGASIEDLFVRDDWRRQGVGTALVQEAERRAREWGERRLWLAVNPIDNQGARRLYENLGYADDGRPPYLDGVYDGYEDWVIDLAKDLTRK